MKQFLISLLLASLKKKGGDVAVVTLVSGPQGETEAEPAKEDTWWDESPEQDPPEAGTTVV